MNAYTADRAPPYSTAIYSKDSIRVSEPLKKEANAMAGLTAAPLMGPMRNTINASVRPITRALPPLTRTLNISRKAPRNSPTSETKGNAIFYNI